MERILNSDLAIPVWGGIECTVHRVGDTFGNQLARNGHLRRVSDLDLIADLGLKTLRYPVIWETIAPEGLEKANWSWTDERLERLRQLGITPIATLLHHGSGPAYTSLLDPAFSEKFTAFAYAVAERYPWLEYFTPINEPLTTARFSCLYGHWYPHARDMLSFGRALVNECKATVSAMHAIRSVIPHAKLVQTEDMGKCHGTDKLKYQWEMENERRWSSLDLIAGRGEENSFVTRFLRELPEVQKDLLYLNENSCAPDIIGINYYITSERYLDHEYHKYPAWSHGSNGADRYADVDIVRADIYQRAGHHAILKETAERYGLPVALTEVHMGSTRDEQMRWFMEAWTAATKAKREGIDVRGITVWSMLGAYDWNSLLTVQNNFYETGVFDVSSGNPRPTALAALIKEICKGNKPKHPVLQAEGWWKNPGLVNFIFGTKQEERQLTSVEDVSSVLPSPTPKPVLITGATGTLGQAFARICRIRNISFVILSRQEMDIANPAVVNEVLKLYEPWAVVNAAGFVNVDEAETNPRICLRENTEGAAVLAAACRNYGAAFLTISTDMVFSGQTGSAYIERDQGQPLNVYGLSKFLAEQQVLQAYPSSIIIRTSSFFGPWDKHNFLARMINTLERGDKFSTTSGFVISPTYVPDLVNACLDLIIDKEKGIWHITNPAAVTWIDFALITAEVAQLNTGLINEMNPEHMGYKAIRPPYSALESERGLLMPTLQNAIERFITERKSNGLYFSPKS